MSYEDILAEHHQRFILRRRKLLRTWRVVGPVLLLLLIIVGVIMFFNYPLMFNPYEAIERLEAGTLENSTLQLMALLLPIAMLMLFFMLVVVVLFSFAAMGNDKKYLAIIQDLHDAHNKRHGPA